MEKYSCPWCGAKSITTFQKTSRRTYNTGIHKAKNKFWFTCPSCNKEISHKLTPKGEKYEGILIACILVLFLCLLVFTALQMKSLVLISVAMAAVSVVLLILIYGKFTKIVKYEDKEK